MQYDAWTDSIFPSEFFEYNSVVKNLLMKGNGISDERQNRQEKSQIIFGRKT